jgi:(heptosyl)LPS beta-1,4-glucosyltransferase
MNKVKISAIILTKNEEAMILDCLKSIGWADEIILVDDNSEDKTIEIAKKFGVKTIVNAPKVSNFSDRRNLGAKEAKSEWLFYVDADERVEENLKNEIHTVVGSQSAVDGFSAYGIPRKNIRLTKPLMHGGWYPDHVVRLIKKDCLEKWEGELHEQPKIKGEIGYLSNPFLHLSHRGSLEHKVMTTIKWSSIEGERMFLANHPPMNVLRFLSAMYREGRERLIVEKGYKDGLEGMFEGVYQIFSVFISYAKLWEMQINSKK